VASEVKVVFSAQDQATEVAKKLLETLRGLDKEQKAAAAATAQLAAPAKAAAAGFEQMRKSIAGLRNAGGVDAIAKRVSLLAEGLRSASTRAQSLTQLTAAEGQLVKALQRSNLSLSERIRLERELRNVRGAIAGGSGLDVPQSALQRFQQLHGVLIAIATAIGAIRLVRLAGDVIDAADSLHDLSQRTGVSVETLSVLSAEAKKAGVSIDEVAVGFRFLSRSVEELKQGNAEVVESFRAIGLSAKDIKGLSLDQVFAKVATAMSRFEEGSGRSAVATRILGRSGEALIPLLNELANGGLANATEKAKALGGVISGDTARAADDFNDSITNLKTAVSGFTKELVSALAPLTAVIEKVTSFLASFPPGVKAFAAGAVIAGAAATALAAAVGALVIAFGALATVTGVGLIVGAITAIAAAAGLAAAAFSSAARERERLTAPLNKDPQLEALLGGGKPTIVLQDPAKLKALRAARLQASRQQARDEVSIAEAGAKLAEQIESARFAQGLSSLQEFFRARTEIAKQGVANELRALEIERRTLASSPLAEDTQAARVERAREIDSIEAKIAITKRNGETALLALLEQERVARKAAFTEAQQFQAQAFRLQGRELQAIQLEIAQSAQRFGEVLGTLGVDPELISQLRGAFSTLLTDKAAFDDQNRKAEQEFQALAVTRAQIDQKVADGTLSQREGVLALAEAERARIPALQQAATLMAQFAAEIGDPALIAAAAQLQSNIEGIGKVTLESTLLIREFRDNLLSAAKAGLTNFLGDLNRLFSDFDARRQVQDLRGDLSGARRELQALQSQPATPQSQQAISALRTEIRGLENQLDSAKDQLVTLGSIARDAFAGILESVQRLASEIIASALFEKLGSLFGLSGNTAGADALARAGVVLGVSATATKAAGATVAAGAVTLGGSAKELATSGGILFGAAAALQAAASALAAAGIAQAISIGAKAIPIGFAGGGEVRGRGTATSDSILARLSAGEFVIRAAVVDRLGIPFLQALNGLRTPRIRSLDSIGVPQFAEGGLVVQQQAAPTATMNGTLRIEVESTEDHVIRIMESPKGVKTQVKNVQKSSGMFKAALGRG
jgi:hypothetical protein